MYRRLSLLIITLSALIHVSAQNNREFNQISEDGTVTQRSGNSSGNFNKHNNDTTKNKVIIMITIKHTRFIRVNKNIHNLLKKPPKWPPWPTTSNAA